MTRFRCTRIALMMGVAVAMLTAQTAPPQPIVLPVGSALVSEVKGEVVFTSPEGAAVSMQRGSTLTAESKVETAKGSVLLALQDGSQVLIKAHSKVVLKSPNEGKGYSLELFIGQIVVKVRKRLDNAPSFRMGTPSAVITVRGTHFSVEVNKKGKTYVNVFEGVVEVMGIEEGSPGVLIRPGFSTRVEQDRTPEEPRETNPGEGLEDRQKVPGAERSPEDRPRNEATPKPPTQGSEGKPD